MRKDSCGKIHRIKFNQIGKGKDDLTNTNKIIERWKIMNGLISLKGDFAAMRRKFLYMMMNDLQNRELRM